MRALALIALVVGLSSLAGVVGTPSTLPPSVPGPSVQGTVAGPAPLASATTVNVWLNVSGTVAPSVRSGSGFVWYAAAERFVLFGGGQSALSTSGLNDTWSYDPATHAWTNVSPIESPARRSSVPMVYNSRAERAILFGGLAADSPFERNDTWVYDYAGGTWTERSPPDAPPLLASPSMAYDSRVDRVILWGGQHLDRPGDSNATWEYDYTNDTWTNLTAGPAPPAGSSAPMVYDPGADRIVLLPAGDSHAYLFDYATKAWTVTASGRPSGHSVGGFVYDDFLHVSVLFGGISAGPSFPTDAWTYQVSGDAWAPLAAVGHPSGRADLMLGYDPTVNQVTAFGGFQALVEQSPGSYISGSYANDTWELVRASPPTAPLGLSAITGSRQVHLSWTAPTSDGGLPVTGYRVYRGAGGGAATPVATLGDTTAFIDTGLTDGTLYAYNVTALNAAGESDSSAVVSATPSQLIVLPSASQEIGVRPLSVSFQAEVSGGRSPYTLHWAFGDGATSSSATPSHVFTSSGVYDVQLNVTDAFGTWSVSSLAVTAVDPLALAPLAANVTTGATPMAVRFNSTVTGGLAPYTYAWTFGDGATSAVADPTHAYASAGTYTARVNVTDAMGSWVASSLNVTAVAPVSISQMAANVTTGTAPLTVHFQAATQGGLSPVSYAWSFGDGGASTLANPDHTYAAAGTYLVNLTVTDALGESATQSLTVTVSPPPPAEGIPLWIWGAVAVGIGAAALGVVLMLRRRKTGKPPAAP